LPIEDQSVSKDYAARYPPLDPVSEQQGTNDLDKDEGDYEIHHTLG
jgi:hypothetical protein